MGNVGGRGGRASRRGVGGRSRLRLPPEGSPGWELPCPLGTRARTVGTNGPIAPCVDEKTRAHCYWTKKTTICLTPSAQRWGANPKQTHSRDSPGPAVPFLPRRRGGRRPLLPTSELYLVDARPRVYTTGVVVAPRPVPRPGRRVSHFPRIAAFVLAFLLLPLFPLHLCPLQIYGRSPSATCRVSSGA